MSNTVFLEDVFELIRNGANIKQTKDSGGYPITRIETISDRSVNRNKMGYAGIHDISSYSEYVLQDGDILMSHINSETHLGKTALYHKNNSETIIHGMNLLCLRADFNKIYPSFVNYFFQSYMFTSQISSITKKSVNQASFSISDLKKLKIPLPPLETQQQIAATLDKVTHIIDLCSAILEKLDLLVKARFVEMFGDMFLNPYKWQKIDFGTVCDVRDGTHDSPQYYDTGYPLITSKNITSGIIDFSDCNFISKDDYIKINERSKVDIGDILMPMIGTVGKPVIVNTNNEFAIKNVALIKFRKPSKVINVFINALLQSDYFDVSVISKIRGGTQKFISLGDIRKLPICIPPLALQQQFAAFVEQTDKTKQQVRQTLEQAETLKKALMQAYFG